jgi:hypothetical protein
LRRKSSELLSRSEAPGLLLLSDLRELYLSAQGAELAWTVLGQAAKVARDQELVAVASAGAEGAVRCVKWLRTRIKEAVPQILATG